MLVAVGGVEIDVVASGLKANGVDCCKSEEKNSHIYKSPINQSLRVLTIRWQTHRKRIGEKRIHRGV